MRSCSVSRLFLILTTVLLVAGCSSTSKAPPIGSSVISLSDAELVRLAVTNALAGKSGVDQACLQRELASIPADFSFPLDTLPGDDGYEDNGSGDSPATDPLVLDTAPVADPSALDTTPATVTGLADGSAGRPPSATQADPLDALSNNDCGGNVTTDDTFARLAQTPSGEELVVRILAAAFTGQGAKVDLTCLRTVIASTNSHVVADLLSAAGAPPDNVTAQLTACTK